LSWRSIGRILQQKLIPADQFDSLTFEERSHREVAMNCLTSRQLVQRALAGLDTPRAAVGPLAVHYCAGLAGVSIRRYTTNPTALADSVARYYETFRPDAVWVSADTWVSAEAMGAAVRFPDDNQPMCGVGEPLVQTASDIDSIKPPDPGSQGRWPIMLEALRQVRDRLGEEAFIVACFDQYPFSLACAAMGINQLMLKLLDDQPMVTALLEKCSEYAIAYAQSLGAAGADMLSGGDSPTGLIGPELYRDVALPHERRVIEQIKQQYAGPVSLHICGNATSLLPHVATSGADVLELDHNVDVATACNMVGPEIGIWGNLDPVSVLAHGDAAEVQRAARGLVRSFRDCNHRRFVLSSGCTLAPETPPENLTALIEATSYVEETVNH